VNIDIQEGGYYDNNVFIEPFSFPEGDCFRHDRIAERRDFTCVFDLTSSDWKDYISNMPAPPTPPYSSQNYLYLSLNHTFTLSE